MVVIKTVTVMEAASDFTAPPSNHSGVLAHPCWGLSTLYISLSFMLEKVS